MKIEKISDNILKVTISKADFANRNIDSMHLKVTSRSYRNFINDIVAHAENELGFEVTGEQLIVETKPGNNPGDFVVFVKGLNPSLSRIGAASSQAGSNLPESEKIARDLQNKIDEEIRKLLDFKIEDKLPELPLPKELEDLMRGNSEEIDVSKLEKKNNTVDTFYDGYDILCFENFDDLSLFCTTFESNLKVSSSLFEYTEKYFLVLKLSKTNISRVNKIENRATEFNACFVPSENVLPLLLEHGTCIIRKGAMKTVAENFG